MWSHLVAPGQQLVSRCSGFSVKTSSLAHSDPHITILHLVDLELGTDQRSRPRERAKRVTTSKGCRSPKELQTVRLAGGLTTAGGHLKTGRGPADARHNKRCDSWESGLAWVGAHDANLDDARRQVTPQRLVTWPGLAWVAPRMLTQRAPVQVTQSAWLGS
jgi:hypothetical protein